LTRETRSAHKVGFIREKGKAAPRDRQGAQKISSFLCLHRGVFDLVLSVGAGIRSQGWSLNKSLQEHVHSPVKASCLSVLWRFELPRLVKPRVPLQDVELTVLSWGMGALAHSVF
jgi:hypothetical protein